jgi:hypothetical protein
MSENDSQALVQTSSDAAIRTAISFWAEGSTRAETFERHFKLQDRD